MTELWASLHPVFAILLALLPIGLWCAYWLLCVNWKRAWPFLAEGAWIPVVFLGFISALVWSRLEQRPGELFGVATLPNFWWQLLCVTALIGVALACGWLQGVIRFSPVDVPVEMPTGGHDDHGHGHDHGHDHHHNGHGHEASPGHAHH